MNKFELIGRITKDPETRYTKEGKGISTFTIAVNNSKEDTTFVKITTFSGTSDLIQKYAKKGTLIYVDGIIKNNNYEDKDGVKHYEYVFIGNKIELLSRKEETKVVEIPPKEDNKKVFEDFGNGGINEELSF